LVLLWKYITVHGHMTSNFSFNFCCSVSQERNFHRLNDYLDLGAFRKWLCWVGRGGT